MSRISSLVPDDREWLNNLIDSLIFGRSSVRTTSVTNEVIQILQAKEADGDVQAARAVEALATDGVRSHVETRIKVESTSVKISHTGEVIQLPARVGHRKRNSDGAVERAFQQTLWYELPWSEFIDMMQARQRQHERDGVALIAFDEILNLHDLYPDSKTPLEACDLAGIDPAEFDLTGVA